MDCIENGIYMIIGSSTQTDKSVPMHYSLRGGGKCLKRVLTHLQCTKYGQNNNFHLGIQKYVSYKKKGINSINILYIDLHKRIPI